MNNNNFHSEPRSSIFPFQFLFPLLFTFLFLFSHCQRTNEGFDHKSIPAKPTLDSETTTDEKQKGMHVFGLRDTTNFQILIRNNIEWVTLVPWGYQADYNSQTARHFRGDSLEMLQSDTSWVRRLKLVRSNGFKVFLKPHVWIHEPSDGKWRSDIFPDNDENWELWQTSYTDFIMRYAKIAEQADVEMFCIGTEFTRLSIEKPAFWKELIPKIRSVYSGKLTYAGNWYKEYEDITFWSELDYIGIQAYFPLVKNKNPTTKEISKGWNKYLSRLESLSKKYNRKILFTEMGYKSTTDSAIKPWEWIEYSDDQNKSVSNETQANSYEAFFKTVWNEEWFAGVHIWQLRLDKRDRRRGFSNLDFTPLDKPAEGVIAIGYE